MNKCYRLKIIRISRALDGSYVILRGLVAVNAQLTEQLFRINAYLQKTYKNILLWKFILRDFFQAGHTSEAVWAD